MIRFLQPFIAVFLTGLAASAEAPLFNGGYLFTTFKGEATPMTEQIYFGLSPDGFHWDVLNDAHPALVSDIGEKGVRDSYLLRSHDGRKFFLIATDLSINLNRDWHRATHAGSKSIVVWESGDLVKWSVPRLVKVAPDDAGCTWAPEAIYDEETKDYLVYWSSTTGRDNFAKLRIWSAHTTDFKTFSPSEILIDKPSTVYDADIICAGGKYYRFAKDSTRKAITLEAADRLSGPWLEIPSPTLAAATQRYEGPAAFQLGNDGAWCLMLDNGGYKAFTTIDLASGKFTASDESKFPFKFRHGSVLPLSAEEYQRVKTAFNVGLKN